MVVITSYKGPNMVASYVVRWSLKVGITLYKGLMMVASSIVQRSFDGCYYVA
jgi:hypothetical protein